MAESLGVWSTVKEKKLIKPKRMIRVRVEFPDMGQHYDWVWMEERKAPRYFRKIYAEGLADQKKIVFIVEYAGDIFLSHPTPPPRVNTNPLHWHEVTD